MDEQDLYRSLVENSELIAYWLDVNGVVRFVSPAAERLLGYTASEVLGHGYDYFVHPEDVPRATVGFQQQLSGQLVPLELRISTKKGDFLWLRIDATQFYSQGQLAGVIGFLSNISEHKQVQSALTEVSGLHRQVVASAAEGIAVLDRELRYVAWNPYLERLLGRSASEAIGRRPWEVFPGLEKYGAPAKLKSVLLGNTAESPDMLYPSPDGRSIWLKSEYNPLRDAQGNITGALITVHDITERKLAENALRDSEERYRDLCENSQDLLCTHDLEGTLLWVNPASARMMGYEPREMMGLRIRDHLEPKLHEQFDEYLETIKRDRVARGLLSLHTRRGERRIWEYNNTLRSDGVSAPIVRGMAHDVTERVLAERELRKSEERFRVALKAAPIVVFNQDAELRYTWMYDPSQTLPETSFLGKTDSDILGPENANVLTAMKREVLESGQGLRREVSLTHGEKTRHVEISIEPLRATTGAVIGITGAKFDVTELHEKTAQLRVLTRKLTREKRYLEREIQGEHNFEEIVGESTTLRHVLDAVEMVAATDSTVLILGETGTGKELVARAIHHKSTRSRQNFIKLNCSAIPTGLLESELFGHEKGAFTGAISLKVGRLELADQGTLFLDEIGDIPLELQPKLLRVLQDQEFERLGSTKTIRVNVRLVAATNRNLSEAVEQKLYRRDLYYRLNVFPVRLPPLRERPDDIPLLVAHFVRKFSRRMNKQIEQIPEETMAALVEWSWPGNVRELENFIERSVILSEGPWLDAPLAELDSVPEGHTDKLEEAGRDYIIRVLKECGGIISGPKGAAMRLGLKRTTLQSKMQRYGITRRDYDDSLTK